MECKLNKISSEELTDKAMNIRAFFLNEIDGLSIGEVVQLMGIFNACVCNDVAKAAKGQVTMDDVLGGIYHLSATSLKVSKGINKR